jgi:CRP-like cAMP-binding protein
VVEPGASVVVEGAVEDHLFVIVDGRIRIHQGEHTLVELGPGATVGELAALVPEPRSASATAIERSTLLRLGKPVLDELLADRPALAIGIITALVTRLRERRADGSPISTAVAPP